jgi:hypothetical protein
MGEPEINGPDSFQRLPDAANSALPCAKGKKKERAGTAMAPARCRRGQNA